jgi:3'-phosphoadenosine 5'-phosphosulfate sulfotransferase (PAPS reductase)/FAD synthetase
MTPELQDKLAGRRVVASVSGGKDSAAMSLWLTEQGIDHDRVFADTGWEHPETYAYLRGPLAAKIGPIVEVVGRDGGMVNLIRRKGMFPSRQIRFCTEELKVKPILAYLESLDGDSVNAVGIRAAESEARARLTEWEWSAGLDCEVWRPLIKWTEQDVIDIHSRHGLAPNPLYLRGASRVGCWPCIFARKKEIERVANWTPERIEQIEQLEREVTAAASARYAAKGETLESRGYSAPAFFSLRHISETKCTPIERVDRRDAGLGALDLGLPFLWRFLCSASQGKGWAAGNDLRLAPLHSLASLPEQVRAGSSGMAEVEVGRGLRRSAQGPFLKSKI